MIYEPREDSYLMEKYVKKYSKANKKVLDLGTGSGIQAITAKAKGAKVLAADINQEAVKQVKAKGIKAIKSNLFNNIKEKFDLIIFNPPYLPEDKEEPEDSKLITTGGKEGTEIITKFLKQAKKHLNKEGKILLISSSLTKNIEPLIKKYKYNFKKLETKKLFFEELYIYEIFI